MGVAAALLVVATRAVIPEGTGYSDAIYYHLAYAQDWANAGRLVGRSVHGVHFLREQLRALLYGVDRLARGRLRAVPDVVVWFAPERWRSTQPSKIAPARAARADGPSPSGLLAVAALVFYPDLPRLFRLGLHQVPIGVMALLAIVALQIGIRESANGLAVRIRGDRRISDRHESVVSRTAARLRNRAGVVGGSAIGARRVAGGGRLSPCFAPLRHPGTCAISCSPAIRLRRRSTSRSTGVTDSGKRSSGTAFGTTWRRRSRRARRHAAGTGISAAEFSGFREYGASALVVFSVRAGCRADRGICASAKAAADVAVPVFVLTVFASLLVRVRRRCSDTRCSSIRCSRYAWACSWSSGLDGVPRAAPLAVAVAGRRCAAAVYEPVAGWRLHSKRHPQRRPCVCALSRRASVSRGRTTTAMPTNRSRRRGCAATDTPGTSSLFPIMPSITISAATA